MTQIITSHSSATIRNMLLLRQHFDMPRGIAQCALLLCDGLTLRQIAHQTNMTEQSIRTYSKLLYSRMYVHHQHQVVAKLARMGFISSVPVDQFDNLQYHYFK